MRTREIRQTNLDRKSGFDGGSKKLQISAMEQTEANINTIPYF
jgi:hypothetical protein